MEKTDISHEFAKAVMNYFIEHVVFSTGRAAFRSFMKTFAMQLTPTTKLFVVN